ncbi:acyltransferase family protein [Puniceibacterium confluentis]|uniref:acyltransferase family protein n=1 Tax=Puniceibacterium confluentis TaxID=1958944 RepID=UPI0011B38F1E|nr:acyltransferase [Puniceibacterium confluentis]
MVELSASPHGRRSSAGVRLWGLQAESDAFLRLDLLRFIASMGIVLFHYSEWVGIDRQITSGLQLFVDVFFVISGLVICYVYSEKVHSRAQIQNFWISRIARIVPLHWAMTLAYVSLGLLAGALGMGLNQPEKYDISCLPGVMTLTHAFGGCDHLVYNFVSWSISAEFAMYLLFPVLALIIVRSRLAVLALFVGALGALYLLDDGWWTRSYNFGVLRALPGFLLGCVLYLWRAELSALRLPGVLFGPVLASLLAGMILIEAQGVTVLLSYLAVTLIYAMDRHGPPNAVMIRLSLLGQLTYSLYMLHPLFQTVALSVIGERILGLQGSVMTLYVVASLPVLIGLSYLSLVKFETPMRRLVRKRLATRSVEVKT